MKLPEPPVLRELNRDDEQECNLVLAGMLHTYLGTVEKPRSLGIDRCVMYELYPPVVTDLLARSTVLVAQMPDRKDVVYGWMMWEGEKLHYVCVKAKWQRLGIASWLLADFLKMPVTYTHRTPSGMALPVPASWTYEPMARFKEAA